MWSVCCLCLAHWNAVAVVAAHWKDNSFRAVIKLPFVSCTDAVTHMKVCVLTPVRLQQRINRQDNEESSAQGLCRPAASLVRRCPREHPETLGTACLSIWKSTFWFHRWDLQRQKPDDCGTSRSRAVWFLWVAEGALGSPSAVLEDPLQKAGSSPAEVQRLAHPSPSVSPPRPHLKLSGQPPRGMMPVALLGSQLRITQQFIKAACQRRLCWVDTSLQDVFHGDSRNVNISQWMALKTSGSRWYSWI